MADEPVAQPFLHELVSCVAAPTVALSGRDGQIRPGGVEGVLHRDVRVLSEAVLTVAGRAPEPVGHTLTGTGGAVFVSVVRGLGDRLADPTVRVERVRTVSDGRLRDVVRLVNDSRLPVRCRLELRLGSDLAPITVVKEGIATRAVRPEAGPPADGPRWQRPGVRVLVDVAPAPDGTTVDGDVAVLGWDLTVPSRRSAQVELAVRASVEVGAGLPAFVAAPTRAEWADADVRSADQDLTALARRSLSDVDALRTAAEEAPDDVFLAAGSPWFFTLFGRDSLWSARLLLPFGTDLGHGTLRALAARQGRRIDGHTGEAPGKILHEVRTGPDGHDGLAVYYGTIDATPLWISLLHDAWRWGLPERRVEPLLPALTAAVGWLAEHADPDGDGFVEYLDSTGRGLANQGWKDSGDSIQHLDTRIAAPPIALVEAQAYAHRALLDAAALLEAFGRDGTDARARAADLAASFRHTFWVTDADGPYPALALDGSGRPVASLTSNLGHLPGSGLLDPAETALVAGRLGSAELDSGYGLRTLARSHRGFNPLGYHTGSVWPHDTAIAVLGLARAGHPRPAAALGAGLVAAGRHFGYRLPELFGGTAAGAGEPVLAYPAACRPQAWSAAAVVGLLTAALGLTADIPAGTVRIEPDAAFAGWFPLAVSGLRVAGERLDVEVDAAGKVQASTAADVTLHCGHGW